MAFNQQNPLIPLSSLHCTFNPLFLNFFRRIQSYNNGEFFTLLCNLNCSKEEQRKQEVAETNDEKQTTTLIYPGLLFTLGISTPRFFSFLSLPRTNLRFQIDSGDFLCVSQFLLSVNRSYLKNFFVNC
ncbi:hypothetical protein Bca4012_072614 [Brassica carinata]